MKLSLEFFFCLLILSDKVHCNDNSLDFDIDKLKAKLPEGIELPDSLKNATLPSFDEVKKLLREKCKKVAGDESKYDAIEKGAEDLKNCTSGLVDVEQLQREIEAAQPSGELDTVFNKYVKSVCYLSISYQESVEILLFSNFFFLFSLFFYLQILSQT